MIGLVLSGGGARALTHVGMLKVLVANNIQFDKISCCSMGALIGACFAFDRDIGRIEELLLELINKKWDYYDYTFSTKGVIKGERLERRIREYFGGKDLLFEDLNIALVINATDLVNGKEVIFDKGSLIPAIMASMSYPGFFTMRKINGLLLVDGGIVNPLPLNQVSEADYLILLDASQERKNINESSNMKDIVIQSTLIMQYSIVEKYIDQCTKKFTLIRPNVSHLGIFDFENPTQLIKLGEAECSKHINNILKNIDDLNRENTGKINVYQA